MIKNYLLCLSVVFISQSVFSQWNPDAGVVASFTKNATVITSSGGTGNLAIDGNNNTSWQSGGSTPALPQGYFTRPDLNIFLGMGSTAQCTNSGLVNAANTTDGNPSTVTSINIAGGNAWIKYAFNSPVSIRTLSVKCGVSSPIQIYAYHQNGDSTLISTLVAPSDNFAVKKFSPLLTSVKSIKLISTARFSVFEVAAMSKQPTEYLTVDLGQTRQVGYIETRHWSNGNATATAIYLSTDNVNWSLAGTVNPDALLPIITRPPVQVNTRYVKIEHTLFEVDYAKGFVWEVRVFDKNGPFGPFPAPKPHGATVRDILGVNGIWGWGHNMYTNSIVQGQGATRFNKIATHARNYHNMHWDIDDPDDTADYANMPFGLALWWLDWDREYLAWNDRGLKVQASIQFNEWIPQTRMANWDDPYGAAYNYGYTFANHFGPTNGNGLVDILEIGNEPWTYPAWFYLTVFDGMLQGAKAADPALKVLPCALQSNDPGTENASGGNYMGARLTPAQAALVDGINIHHYSYTTDDNGQRIAVNPEHPESEMRAAVNDIRFRDANMPGKKIYLSEWGWDSDGVGEGCSFGECVSENEQALYAVRGAMMFMRLGIDRVTWYFYGNQGSGNLYSRSGLEGNPPNHDEKQAYRSFHSFVHLLGDAHFLDVLREDDNAWIYLFGDEDNNPTHVVAWRPIEGDDNTSLQVNLTTSLQPDSAWTITGQSYTGELVSKPTYNSGSIQLTIRSAPLVVKVSTVSNGIFVWTGNSSTDWNNPLNWSNYVVPDVNAHVTIPNGRPHYPSNYAGDVEIATLVLDPGSEMTVVPGSDLTVTTSLILNGGSFVTASVGGISPVIHIKGNFVKSSGSFQPGTSKVIFNGTGPQQINGSLTFYDLELDNNSTLEIIDAVSANGIISVMDGSTLITNNKLTIESGGSLMHGPNTPGGQQGNVAGNVIVKRAGSSNPQKFNFWSSPVQNANVSTIGSQPYYYNPANAQDTTEQGLRMGWVSASGIMQPAVGYISKGAGTVSFNGVPTSAPTATPVLTAVRKNAGVQNSVPYNLVGNPFPSALDGKKFLDMNGPAGSGVITGALYFWDDDGSGGIGWNTSQDYAVWNGAGLVAGYNSGTIFQGNIASGQSFFVEKIADGTLPLLFDNTMRTTENNSFFRLAPKDRLWINITNPDSDYNETLIAFLPDADDGLDLLYDAKKLIGNAGIALYSKLNGGDYAIQSFSKLTMDKIVPLGFKTNIAGTHTISLKTIEGLDETAVVILKDIQTGTFTNLRLDSSYAFSSAAGTFDGRFLLHFYPPLEFETTIQDCDGTPGELTISQYGGYSWDYVIKDLNGVVVNSGNNISGTLNIALAGGDYTLELIDDYNYTVLKQVNIAEMKQAQSNYSHDRVNREIFTGTEIYFTDLSSGSDFNEWDFGDGYVESNTSNPHHAYSQAGTYQISLSSWNTDCSDEFVSSLVVKENKTAPFTPGTTTGAGSNTDEVGINIIGNENRVLVEFLFSHSESSVLNVYDVAGKKLFETRIASGGTHQISVPALSRAVYFVKITTPVKTFTSKLFLGKE